MRQASDEARKSEIEGLKTIDDADFRVAVANPEALGRAERLRTAIRDAGGNKAVTATSGVPSSTLHAYMTGQEWKVSAAIALADACAVSVEWLLTGRNSAAEGAPVAQLPPAADKYVMIPRFDVRASAGPGTPVDQEDILGLISFDEMFLRRQLGVRPETLTTLEATGDSMMPTIRDGDLLLIDTDDTDIRDGRIYVLSFGGFLSVKRLQITPEGSVAVVSDNDRYPARIINPTEHDPLRIVGRVVYQAGPVRS